MFILARGEWAGGNLAFEFCRPAAGDFVLAFRAMAFGAQTVVLDQVAIALDQSVAAHGAASVFPRAYLAREIAGVDVAEAGLAADFSGMEQIFGTRISWTGHLVVAVECGYMPGNVGRDSGQKFGQAADFVFGVVEAGNEERHDFEPQAHFVNAADAFEDGADASAEFVIVPIVEAL